MEQIRITRTIIATFTPNPDLYKGMDGIDEFAEAERKNVKEHREIMVDYLKEHGEETWTVEIVDA